MLESIGIISFGLILLVVGGESLLRGAVGLATLMRLTPAVIGLTVVAAGTSVPELAVSGIASWEGRTALAVTNVVGSNIFNITVILGLCALFRPLQITGNTIRLEYPVLAGVTVLALAVARDGGIDRLDATILVAVYVAFTAYTVRLVRKQVTPVEAEELRTEVQELNPASDGPRPWVSIGLVGAGVLLLAGGAQFTITGAVEIARLLGWSERIIGLTIVSAGTGLPEVVASLVSSVRGRTDVAIGNVIGSNLFNILGILGISAFVAPLAVEPMIISNDNWWMLGVTLLLFPVMFSGFRVSRWEGALLIATYAVYLGLLLTTGVGNQ